MLARHQAAIPINWLGLGKRDRLPSCETTVAAVVCATPRKGLQGFDHRPNLGRPCFTASSMALLHLRNPFGDVVDFLEIMRHCDIQRRLFEADVNSHPVQVPFSPACPASMGRLPWRSRNSPAFGDGEVISLRRFSRPYQIALRLVFGLRNPYGGSIRRHGSSGPALGVPTVGLHPVPSLSGDQGWGDHLASHPHLSQLPVQHMSRRARLVTAPQRPDRGPACR